MSPPSPSDRRYRLHPDVVWIERPDGSVHLMHMSANVCAIDAEAAALLRAIFAVGPAPAAAELAARDGMPAVEAETEVADFIRSLRRQRLIQPAPDEASVAPRDRTAIGVIRGALRLVDTLARTPRTRTRGMLWAARWAVFQFGWARAIRAWEVLFPQPADVAIASPQRLAEIDEAVREIAASSLVGLECKERSLVCLALARTHGVRAQLIVGIAHDPMQGHVWVEAAGRILGDDPEHYRSFDRVACYG
ncbi:MAG TPA: lasso peptide biosynthesis B2 protein [Acetobacteraceae bacterium]|nr:lasso peptide biosynthesis B2 protein [Acetobacteraceae bacterium]